VTSSPSTPRPITTRQVVLVGAAASLLLLILAGAVVFLLTASRPAAAQLAAPAPEPASGVLLVAKAGRPADTILDPIDGPSVPLLLDWRPGDAPFTAPCATPISPAARYAHGPQYVRLDCDHDGLADVWALAVEAGISDDVLLALPEENDSHERLLVQE